MAYATCIYGPASVVPPTRYGLWILPPAPPVGVEGAYLLLTYLLTYLLNLITYFYLTHPRPAPGTVVTRHGTICRVYIIQHRSIARSMHHRKCHPHNPELRTLSSQCDVRRRT